MPVTITIPTIKDLNKALKAVPDTLSLQHHKLYDAADDKLAQSTLDIISAGSTRSRELRHHAWGFVAELIKPKE